MVKADIACENKHVAAIEEKVRGETNASFATGTLRCWTRCPRRDRRVEATRPGRRV